MNEEIIKGTEMIEYRGNEKEHIYTLSSETKERFCLAVSILDIKRQGTGKNGYDDEHK
jgi:hypothetical protein